MSTLHFVSRESILALLSEAGLPTTDLPADLQHFTTIVRDGQTLACGGLEIYGKHALLRSVAVVPAQKGRGLGGEIVRQLHEMATTAGAKHLWLLTTDAADFFAKHGFSVVSRDEVPGEIAATQQFAGICPASATAMWKKIG